jgi:hypothetical protein
MLDDNIIDARTYFLGKALMDNLEERTQDEVHLHPYYLLLEEDGKDFIELRVKDIRTNIHIVIDKSPVGIYNDRYNNGEPLFEIG